MSAAARVLHGAIEDAVQQLEPQLLPLFGGEGRNAREQVARPTLRTQLALKTLVALTRFFPEDHRVRQAGRQLELIWPPLVHEPCGAAAAKLLHYYFRLRQDLLDTPERALCRAMRELARGALEAAQVADTAAQADAAVLRLQLLAGFLPEAPLDARRLAHLSPLARLCAWQQGLEAGAGELPERDSVSPLLLPDMLAVLDRCTALCRASNWSLEYFCNSGIARGLWQLRGIAHFCASAAMAELFEELDDECLDMHLAGRAPPPEVLQQWLVRLFAVVHDRKVLRPPPPDMATAPELPFRAVYDHELAQYRRQLQAELQAQLQLPPADAGAEASSTPLKVTAPLITLLYKLTWVFAAAEQMDWSRLCQCAYRIVLQYWRLRRPVSASVQGLLLELAHKPGTLLPGSVLRLWRWQLLRDWPRWTDDAQRPIALRPEAGHVVALEAVPDLLSGSFTTLVQAGNLANAPSAQACEPHYQVLVQDLASELLQELALLEKGAAAMKVWPLEQLCTVLIAVYELHLREEAALPAPLLKEAHRQLLRMLDQAAAWREVQAASGLMQELEGWLQGAAHAHSACREPAGEAARQAQDTHGDSEQVLRAHLLSCLGTLASVLERPVRLQLDAAQLKLDAARMTEVLDCLRPLIKFMLLDQSVDTRMRHAMHKPRVSTLAVSLRATSAKLVVTVAEDSHEDVLPQPELQRLQRRLPKAAGALVCESRAGRGRSFTFTLGHQAAA